MEGLLTDLMFEVPSDPTIEKVVLTAACVTDGARPEMVYNPDKKRRIPSAGKAKTTTRRKAMSV